MVASLLSDVKALPLLQLAVLLGVALHLGDKVNSLPNNQQGVFSQIPNRPQPMRLAEIHLVGRFFSIFFITFSLSNQAQLLISLCLGRSQQLNLRPGLEFLAVANSSSNRRTRNSHHKLSNHLFSVAALDCLVISSHNSSKVLKLRIHVFFSTYLCFLTFLTRGLSIWWFNYPTARRHRLVWKQLVRQQPATKSAATCFDWGTWVVWWQ